MAETFQLDIVTPERTVFSGRAEELVAPGLLGEFGVLPGHANLLAELGVGPLRYRSGGSEHVLAAGGGFAEVTGQRVTVLLDRALSKDEIEVEEMRRALESAQQRAPAPADEQYGSWRASVQWAELCLKIAGDTGSKK
jgi:F-type H+-transporting ATPase subunit epsilon